MDQPGQLGQLSCDTEISYWPTSTWCIVCSGVHVKSWMDVFHALGYLWNIKIHLVSTCILILSVGIGILPSIRIHPINIVMLSISIETPTISTTRILSRKQILPVHWFVLTWSLQQLVEYGVFMIYWQKVIVK